VTFKHPALLIALVVPLLLLWWVWFREGRRVALPVDHGPRLRGRRWRILVSITESALPLLLAIVMACLAGPRIQGDPVDRRKMTNIEMCVDVSGSMKDPFGDATRYDGAMKAVNDFTSYRKGDAFGLTFFGSEVLHWCPLTTDVSAVTCAIPFMRPGSLPKWFDGTYIAKALRAEKEVLVKRPAGDRMIILITDGISNDLANGGDFAVAQELKEAGITVFSIIVSNEVAKPGAGAVETITFQTGGASFNAGDPQALATVFKRIDEMKQTEMEKHVSDTLDHYRPFALAGLCVLGFWSLATLALRYTPW
jgi:Ca-activated chloride channel family protein